MPRYIVDVKSARSRPYIRACVVRVLDTHSGPTSWYWIRRGTVAQWGSLYKREGYALDRRYVGPRSAFGGALRAAQAKARELNNGEGR